MQKLEIGPHYKLTPDGMPKNTWHTVDTHYNPTYTIAWGTEPLPIPDNTYDWVHASHVLEHVPWWNTKKALRDVCRVLKPGGKLTVWVPDAFKIIDMYINDPTGFLQLEKNWPCGDQNKEKDPWVYMNARIFWGARKGELGQEQHFHKALFGYNSLCQLLAQTGFKEMREIVRNKKIDPGHGWMEVGVEALK
jgi:predicted SAM-dependent methyltransferase